VNEKKLQDTAYHEAGHAVAAWRNHQLKMRDYVTIATDPQRGSLGHLRNPPRFISELERSGGASGRAILQAERFAIGCLAGNAAECWHRGGKRRHLAGGGQDREQAVEILSHLVGSNEELTAYFHLLQIRAENLVAQWWPEVEALAARLVIERKLTSDQIRETCLSVRMKPKPCL
jgi:hypothetical protein